MAVGGVVRSLAGGTYVIALKWHLAQGQCALLHANYKPLKCVTPLMQASPSCKTWRGFYNRPADLREHKGPSCGLSMGRHWKSFQNAMRTYFSDCCIDGP